MAEKKYRVVHYLNQFFAQIGGEAEANIPPLIKDGAVGPGIPLQQALGEEGKIVATMVCGDTYFAENIEVAVEKVVEFVSSYKPDVFVAGPAFTAGRYGIACGASCSAVSKKLGIPVVTAMYEENPALELYRKEVYIIPCANSTRGMKEVILKMADFVRKLSLGQEIGCPQENGYFPRGIRVNQFDDRTGAERAVDMLLFTLRGEPFQTEYPMPTFERIPASPPITDMRLTTIALVTSGGIVPRGNPDRIEAASASKFAEYNISGVDDLTPDAYQTCHGGSDPVYANDDPDRVLPLDAMRVLEKGGTIGKLHDLYYVTVGNATSVANSQKFGKAIAEKLKAADVNGVILTST
ncbi:MAG: glycine/betaine/sarcosine/D-proline family reductase selenoprotein B [Dehalococcoidales bacterium]|nr:glycine/betaine/sarcosine/D-proline family reductase selenoprotein B [Dehalococcoidales bacterium]